MFPAFALLRPAVQASRSAREFIRTPWGLLLCSRRMLSFLRYWLPLLLWMILIFSASADTQSTERTSRFLVPFLRTFWPDISSESIDQVRWLVRKGAHLAEYAVLAWLWLRVLQRFVFREEGGWSWRAAAGSLLAVTIYAATDELHQQFVPNRTGSFRDVCIDILGGMLGLIALWMWHRLRQRRCGKERA